MLPYDPDANDAEKLQWVVYQLKVWEKLMVQLTRAIKSRNMAKVSVITNLLYAYGDSISSQEFEFELEKLLAQKEIFDSARDLI